MPQRNAHIGGPAEVDGLLVLNVARSTEDMPLGARHCLYCRRVLKALTSVTIEWTAPTWDSDGQVRFVGLGISNVTPLFHCEQCALAWEVDQPQPPKDEGRRPDDIDAAKIVRDPNGAVRVDEEDPLDQLDEHTRQAIERVLSSLGNPPDTTT